MGIELAVGAAIAAVGSEQQRQGAEKSASAAQNAATAQQREAQRQYNEISGIANKASVAGLASYDRALSVQEKNIARQEQLIAQIDPTVIEASQQALRLLRGEQSATLGPLKNQRDQQRQKLVNSLREQLGPGAETSSVGMQALTRFDSETANIFAGAQQQALSNLGQTFGQFNAGRPDLLREATGYANIGQQRAGLEFDRARLLAAAGQPVQQSAGAEYTYEGLKGKANSAFGGQIANFGFGVMGAGLAGGAGAGASAGGGGGFGSMLSGVGDKVSSLWNGGSSPYSAATTGGFLGSTLGADYNPDIAKNRGARQI